MSVCEPISGQFVLFYSHLRISEKSLHYFIFLITLDFSCSTLSQGDLALIGIFMYVCMCVTECAYMHKDHSQHLNQLLDLMLWLIGVCGEGRVY